ncbi:MAG: hypothetical protein ACHQT9_03155 [Candidatus Saccharimonadales bacterium]
MLVVPKFVGYERPEGREAGHPEVRVRKYTAEKFGIPAVDYDSLARLFWDEIKIDREVIPIISIFSRFYDTEREWLSLQALHSGVDNYSYRTGRIIHVNADGRKDRKKPLKEVPNGHVMSSVMIQAAALAAKHRNEGINSGDITRSETIPVLAGIGGYAISGGDPGFLIAGTVAGAVQGARLLHTNSKLLKTEAEEQLYELDIFHTNDIDWPSHYDRTHSAQDT